jgi:tetratricopeptide (TPR) repeat protein
LQLGAHRARVNVQLISANDGIHLWADRFDKEVGDALDLQDEIAERTSRAIVVQLRDAEIKRGTETTRASLDAATLVQLGRRTFTQAASRKNSIHAAEIYKEAVRVDEKNALAHALLSITKTVLYVYMWSDAPDADLEEATRHCDRARLLDPSLPYAQVASAWLLFAERKFGAALAAFERIAETAPLAGGNAYSNLAVAKMNFGRAAEAEIDLLRAIRVFPSDPQMDVWHFYLGFAYSYQGKYAEAAEAFRKSTSLNADLDFAHVCLAAVSVQLGKMQDASASVRQAQVLGTRWTIRTLKAAAFAGTGVGVDDARMNALWDGLRLAGLPE